MKNTIFFVLLFAPIVIIAQYNNSLITKNLEENHLKKETVWLNLFTYGFKENKTLKVDRESVNYLQNHRPKTIDLSVPSEKGSIILELYQSTIFANKKAISFNTGEIFKLDSIVTYRGRIKDDTRSLATVSIYGTNIRVMYSNGNGTFEINKIGETYQLINTNKFTKASIGCQTIDNDLLRPMHDGIVRSSFNDCIEIHIDLDHELYLLNGNPTAAATYLINVFNDVATIYANAGVSVILSSSTIWVNNDGFSNSNLLSLKDSYVQYLSNTGYVGRIAYLMSGKSIGGGISDGIGGFCNNITQYPGPCALTSAMVVPTPSFPIYSYNVYNVSHELGHVMGLRHSHACVWNGNDTQIDDCGNVYSADNNLTIEGLSCFDEYNPQIPAEGTIMSYCNLINSSNINLSVSFGGIAGPVLYNNYANSSCVTGNNCGSIPPPNDNCAFALPIGILNQCKPKTYDNNNASSSGELPNFSCGNFGITEDVWFYCIVPPSGEFTFETRNTSGGGLNDLVVQSYTGACGSLNLINCDDNSGEGNQALLYFSGRTPGEKIYFRIIDSGSNEQGDFDICAFDPFQPCHPDFNLLIDFYNETAGPNWINKTGWQEGANNLNCNVCNWYGVVCNDDQRVIELNLGNNNLTGTIPGSITQIDKLRKLNLYSNNLSGPLPTYLNQLSFLSYLDFGRNEFTGPIPLSISQINNLQTLFLDKNQLSGPLLPSLASLPLNTLWLNENNFSGCIPTIYDLFCQNPSVNVVLNDNPLLPFGGDFAAFCLNGSGGDFDNDGFCAFSEDCIDHDSLSYPGAVERCDGSDNDCNDIIDDNVNNETITWIGNKDSLWSTPANWDLVRVPLKCNDVLISPNTLDSVWIKYGSKAFAASLSLQQYGYLNIQNGASLTISDEGGVLNHGNMRIIGTLLIENSNNSWLNAIDNYGNLSVASNGRIEINNYQTTGIYNHNGGYIMNTGQISLNSNSQTSGLYGILNEGHILNEGYIKTIDINGKELVVKVNALLNNINQGVIELK